MVIMYRALPSFDYVEPKSVAEAVEVLARYGAKAKILAGGTDLLVSMKKRQQKPDVVICIKNIPDLDYIQSSKKDGLRIGALATHESVHTSRVVQEGFAALATACSMVGTPHIRTMGTIGGNVCMAGPSQDSPPALLVLEARLKLVSAHGERIVPIGKFFVAPFRTAIELDELLTEIQVPTLPPRTATAYLRNSKRTVVDESLAGVAIFMTVTKSNLCKEIRIGLSSLAPTAMRAIRAEGVLRGQQLSDKLIEEAAQTAAEEVKPRSRADQRRRMTGILVRRGINEVWQKIQAAGK